MERVFEPVLDTVKEVSKEVRKTKTETSIEGFEIIAGLNENVRESMNDKVFIASNLVIILSNTFKRENIGHFKSVEDPNSNKVIDVFLTTNTPVTVF